MSIATINDATISNPEHLSESSSLSKSAFIPPIPPAVSFKHFTLMMGDKTILEDVSSHIQCGEFTILLGPNGAGKSSLLKLICREWPHSGYINYFNQRSEAWTPSALARHMGVLPQHSDLSFNFSAKEVVELGGLTLAKSARDIQSLAEYNMIRTDVARFKQRLYPTLSGGEKQRVHLARVLTQLSDSGDKQLLLLDEPTSALDIQHQHRTLQLAREIAMKGAAVVAVIHDLNLAAQYGDRLIMLSQGKIACDGKAKEVLTPRNIAQVYGYETEVIPHPTKGYPVIL